MMAHKTLLQLISLDFEASVVTSSASGLRALLRKTSQVRQLRADHRSGAVTDDNIQEFVDGLLDAGVKPPEFKLAMLILSMSVLENGKDWTELITVEKIARRLGGIVMASASKHIKKLKERGFLVSSRDGGGPNAYQVRIPEKGSFSTMKSTKIIKRPRKIRMR